MKEKTGILLFLDVVFLVAPGVAAVFVFYRKIFLTLDWVRLVLLSISLVAPLVLVNMLFRPGSGKDREPAKDESFYGSTLAIIMTGLLFYFGLAIVSVFDFDIGQFYILLIVAEIILLFKDGIVNFFSKLANRMPKNQGFLKSKFMTLKDKIKK